MKLIDEKEYRKNLRELLETPFGGYQEKQTIKQLDPESKVITKQPIEIQTKPVSATSQPQIHIIKEQQSQPSPLYLKKELSLARLGVVMAVGGAIFGYLYVNNPSVKSAVTTGLTKLSVFMDNPIILGSIVIGVLICTLGLIFRR